MSKSIAKLLFSFCFFVNFSTILMFAQSPVLTFAYSEVEFFPFQSGNGASILSPPGVAVELISEAARALGIRIEFIRHPNKRVQESLKSGLVHGAFCFSFSEDRLAMGAYPMKGGQADSALRITTVSYFFYILRQSRLKWDGKQLFNLQGNIGTNAGNSINANLQKLNLPYEEAKSTEQNLLKLKSGRIAAFAAQDITTDKHVETGNYGDIIRLTVPIITKDYFLMLSNQFVLENPDLARKLWVKIAELRDTRVPQLLLKYSEPSLP